MDSGTGKVGEILEKKNMNLSELECRVGDLLIEED
jgi:hypothetical protein